MPNIASPYVYNSPVFAANKRKAVLGRKLHISIIPDFLYSYFKIILKIKIALLWTVFLLDRWADCC